MTTDSSLMAKHVLIPRGKDHAQSFTQLVKKYGGIPVEVPLIAFKPVPISESFLRELHSTDWLIFTSNVTVESLFTQIDWSTLQLPLLKIAAIGKKTAETLRQFGVEVDFTPSAYVAEVFAKEFLPHVKEGMRVMIPKGNLAREHIAEEIKKRRAIVNEVIVYETYFPEESKVRLAELLKKEELDVITFTSPSTVDHFMSVVNQYQLKDRLSSCYVACIGPVTEKRAIEHRLPVDVVPTTYTIEHMLNQLIKTIEMRESK